MTPGNGSSPEGGTPLGQRYILHEVIGRGAMGQVYRATVTASGEEVAAKVLRPELCSDADLVARFVQERNILTGIDDPHVVRVRDLVVEGETLAIVADLVPGPDLRRFLALSGGTLAPSLAVQLILDVLAGLVAVHDQKIVHRDIKPENVLVDLSGVEPAGRLADFGIARLAHGPSLTRLTGLIGTPEYLAPELSEKASATPAADVYGAGIMLYELLCGVTPFAGRLPVAMLKAHVDEHPGAIPSLAEPLWDALVPMLAKAPSQRPLARAASESLVRLLPGLEGLAALSPLSEPPPTQPVAATESTTFLGRLHEKAELEAQRQAELAEQEGRRREHRRRRRLMVTTGWVAAVAVAAGLLFTILPASASSVSQVFDPAVFNQPVARSRTWTLTGDTLDATVTVTNVSATTTDLVYDEVIPKSVARSADDLRLVRPAPTKIVQMDPVLRFVFRQVPPNQSRTIHYEATVAGLGATAQRLAVMASAEERAESAYYPKKNGLRTLTLSPASLSLSVGQVQRVTLTGTMEDGAPAPSGLLATATWASSAAGVATISSNGTIQARTPGSATVSVSLGAARGIVPVTVVAPNSATTSTTAPAGPVAIAVPSSPTPSPGPIVASPSSSRSTPSTSSVTLYSPPPTYQRSTTSGTTPTTSTTVTTPSAMKAQTTRCKADGAGQAYVYWVPPSSDGGSPITDYRITAYNFTTSSFLSTEIASGSATSFVYTGLENGDTYNFAVAAENSAGVGTPVYTNTMSPPSTTGP